MSLQEWIKWRDNLRGVWFFLLLFLFCVFWLYPYCEVGNSSPWSTWQIKTKVESMIKRTCRRFSLCFRFLCLFLCVQHLTPNTSQCAVKFSIKCSSHLQSDAKTRILFESHEGSGKQWRYAACKLIPEVCILYAITVASERRERR